MDRAFIGLIGGMVAVGLAILAVIYIGTFFITVGAGLFGLVCVKTKHPIVNPHGNLAVTLAYSVAWSAAITVALLLGGSLLNEVRGVRPSGSEALILWRKDAILFFLEAVWVLFMAARFPARRILQNNPAHASAVVSAMAAIMFSISSRFLDASGVFEAGVVIVREILETVLFPVMAAFQMLTDSSSAIEGIWQWMLTASGNLFKLSSIIAKIVWLYALFQLLRGLGNRQRAESYIEARRDSLSGRESTLFSGTMLTMVVLVGIVWLSYYENASRVRFGFWIDNPFLTFFLAYIVLWVFLWMSRAASTRT